MKTPLVAMLALFPLAVAAAEPAPAAPAFKFELPPLKAADALKQRPLILWAPLIYDTEASRRSFSFQPAMPATLPATSPASRAQILIPKNVDPNMPIKKPDAAIDPRIFVPTPGAKSGK